MKHAGWWVAAVLAVGLALVEWRPWHDATQDTPRSGQEGATPQSPQQSSGGAVQPVRQPPASATVMPARVSDAAPAAPTPATATDSAGVAAVTGAMLEKPSIRAQLSPLHYTTVAAELGAKVQALPFKEGESFEPGQVLVEFDCSVQQAQLARVRATLAIAQRNASTNQRLLSLGTVSRVEAENSFSELARARAEVQELEAIVSKCKIAAPFQGKVVEQKVRSQQFVQVGQPLLDILDSSGLELEFLAPSKWAPWLKVGHVFEIRVDETGKTYPARVTRVAARIDSVSQTLKVAALVDGEYTELSPGMSGTITVNPPATSP